MTLRVTRLHSVRRSRQPTCTALRCANDRLSQSPTDHFTLIVGDGEIAQGQLLMTPIATYRRTAAETGGYVTDISLELVSP